MSVSTVVLGFQVRSTVFTTCRDALRTSLGPSPGRVVIAFSLSVGLPVDRVGTWVLEVGSDSASFVKPDLT